MSLWEVDSVNEVTVEILLMEIWLSNGEKQNLSDIQTLSVSIRLLSIREQAKEKVFGKANGGKCDEVAKTSFMAEISFASAKCWNVFCKMRNLWSEKADNQEFLLEEKLLFIHSVLMTQEINESLKIKIVYTRRT